MGGMNPLFGDVHNFVESLPNDKCSYTLCIMSSVDVQASTCASSGRLAPAVERVGRWRIAERPLHIHACRATCIHT